MCPTQSADRSATKRRSNDDWPDSVTPTVQRALEEDIRTGDATAALVPADAKAKARVITREAGVICGQPWFDEVFRQIDPSILIEWSIEDGASVPADAVLCYVSGPARPILTGERTALNFLQTLSGTASITAKYAHELRGTDCQVLDTRKTIPGLRQAQKYAVATGGGHNHRIGLYDAILIKENHIASCGGVEEAISQARKLHPELLLEVEVEDLKQFELALNQKPDVIMLDNFSVQQMKKAVAKAQFLGFDRPELEVSGNVEIERLRMIAKTGVDFISVGALTKHVRALDLSLRFE